MALGAALRAGTADNLAASATLVASAPNLQKTLLVNHLTAPVAHWTTDQAVVLFRSGSFTARAQVEPRNLDVHTKAANCVLEIDLQVVAQILAALRSAAPALAATAKHIAEAKQVA